MGLEMKYFVLKPRGTGLHAVASRAAMRAYADLIENLDPALAIRLRDWAGLESVQAEQDRLEGN